VSRGAPLVEVPDDEQLRGLSRDEAEGVLTGPGIGLVPEFVDTPSNDVEEDHVIGLADDTPERLPQGSTVMVELSSGPAGPPIPDVTGWDYDDARDALRDLGLDVDRTNEASDEYESGKVIRTEPGADESVDEGGTVVVVVSRGGSGDDDEGEGGGGGQIDVPNLEGMSLDEASEEIQDAGLTVGRAWGNDGGSVLYSNPGAGSQVAEASTVDLVMW
jgi:eukaryotic-like serine/threonine-protein kinase